VTAVSVSELAQEPSVQGYERGTKAYRRVLVALGAVGTATFAQLYFPQALIPAISLDLDVTAANAALTISGATIGLAAAVLGWSWVSDRIGRAKAIKIAIVTAAVIGLLVPFAPSFEALIVLRVLQGVALGGTPALALTYLAEEVHRRDALAAGGVYISGTVIGGLAGRLIAAPIADLTNWRTAGVVVGCLCVAGAALVVLLLPLPQNVQRAENGHGAAPRGPGSLWAGMSANLKNPAMRALYAQAFLLMGAHVATYNYLGYRLAQAPFNLPPALTAAIFLAGLSGALSARLAGRLAARYGRRRVLLGSTATMAAGAALSIPDWIPTVVLGTILFTTAFFSAHTISSGWVGPTATTATAQATGLYTLFYYAGSSLFGWLGGLAFNLGWIGTAAMVVTIIAIAFAYASSASPRQRLLPGHAGRPAIPRVRWNL
jgi:MFS transporter, YNFM family, putative membrane transport protein